MIVLDANIAIAIALDTREGRAFREIIRDEYVFAPKLLYTELANTIWKIKVFGNVSIDEGHTLDIACSIVDEYIDDEYLLSEALHEAIECKHPIYDMLYLVLARRNGAHLFTLDKKLQKLCWEKGVNCIQTIDLNKSLLED